jgi:hypothetical protein
VVTEAAEYWPGVVYEAEMVPDVRSAEVAEPVSCFVHSRSQGDSTVLRLTGPCRPPEG